MSYITKATPGPTIEAGEITANQIFDYHISPDANIALAKLAKSGTLGASGQIINFAGGVRIGETLEVMSLASFSDDVKLSDGKRLFITTDEKSWIGAGTMLGTSLGTTDAHIWADRGIYIGLRWYQSFHDGVMGGSRLILDEFGNLQNIKDATISGALTVDGVTTLSSTLGVLGLKLYFGEDITAVLKYVPPPDDYFELLDESVGARKAIKVGSLDLTGFISISDTMVMDTYRNLLNINSATIDSFVKSAETRYVPISTVPTDTPPEGTTRLYWDGTTARLYAFLGGTWKYVELT